MNDYAVLKCEACRASAPAVSDDERDAFLSEHPGWEVVLEGGMPQLRRVFAFPDFAQALAFTNRVGGLAEAENHHPAILTEWGKVTVRWWTHKIRNLHRNDLIMAARTDQLAAE